MGIGTSLFLLATGAILYFAVEADIEGLEISTVGLILMAIGLLGLAISLYYTSRGTRGPVEPDERPVVRDREYY